MKTEVLTPKAVAKALKNNVNRKNCTKFSGYGTEIMGQIANRYMELVMETISRGDTFTIPKFATFSIGLKENNLIGVPIAKMGKITYKDPNERLAEYSINVYADSEFLKEQNIVVLNTDYTKKRIKHLRHNTNTNFYKRIA